VNFQFLCSPSPLFRSSTEAPPNISFHVTPVLDVPGSDYIYFFDATATLTVYSLKTGSAVCRTHVLQHSLFFARSTLPDPSVAFLSSIHPPQFTPTSSLTLSSAIYLVRSTRPLPPHPSGQVSHSDRARGDARQAILALPFRAARRAPPPPRMRVVGLQRTRADCNQRLQFAQRTRVGARSALICDVAASVFVVVGACVTAVLGRVCVSQSI
jgi:hypothetical protein